MARIDTATTYTSGGYTGSALGIIAIGGDVTITFAGDPVATVAAGTSAVFEIGRMPPGEYLVTPADAAEVTLT